MSLLKLVPGCENENNDNIPYEEQQLTGNEIVELVNHAYDSL